MPRTTTDTPIDTLYAAAEILATSAAMHRATATATEIAITSGAAQVIRLVNNTLRLMTLSLEKRNWRPGYQPAKVGES